MSNVHYPPSDPMRMPVWIRELIKSPPQDSMDIILNPTERQLIQSNCISLAKLAYEQRCPTALSALHSCLSAIYGSSFSVVPQFHVNTDIQPLIQDVTSILERAMLNYEYSFINPERLKSCPKSGKEYLRWLKTLISAHAASAHPFYREFLRDYATADDIRFYLTQETNLDPRFDDILALLQVGMNGRSKMEIAKNYWDEMGNGNSEHVHTSLFGKALDTLQIDAAYVADNMMEEACISGNLSSALALNRCHKYKAIGYFGVTEYIAPSRFKHVVTAWRRNGLPEAGLSYHDIHITIDAMHGASWFNQVIMPAVEDNPSLGSEIALGALIRLNSSARYLDAMLDHLQSGAMQADIYPRARTMIG